MAPALMLATRRTFDSDEPSESGAVEWADVWRDAPDRSVVVQDPDTLASLWDHHDLLGRRSRLLVMGAVKRDLRPLLDALFLSVVTGDEIQGLLPIDQLAEVLESPNRADLIIGGAVTRHAVVLYRGDLRPIIVPRDWFGDRPGGKPNFNRLSIADYGQTVSLGRYEVATEALLYEFDADYRSRLRRDRHQNDESFGGSLRRLRLQRGLRRSDFPGISEKEVARIERGQVQHPRARTMERLARRLEVLPEEISSY